MHTSKQASCYIQRSRRGLFPGSATSKCLSDSGWVLGAAAGEVGAAGTTGLDLSPAPSKVRVGFAGWGWHRSGRGQGPFPPVGRTRCRGPFPLFLRAAGGPWMLTGTLEGLVHLPLPFEFCSVAGSSAPQILLLCPTGNSSPVHLHPRIQNISPLPCWSPNFSCPFPDPPQHQPP